MADIRATELIQSALETSLATVKAHYRLRTKESLVCQVVEAMSYEDLFAEAKRIDRGHKLKDANERGVGGG